MSQLLTPGENLQMRRFLAFLIVAAFLSTPVIALADAGADVDYTDLVKRLEKLEQENITLKNEIKNMKPSTSVVGGTSNFKGSNSAITTTFYGFLQTDLVFENDTIANHGLSYYATLGEEATDEFAMCAGQTRFGFAFDGPAMDNGVKLSGKIEADFLGETSSTTSDKSFRLRQAYAKATGEKWNLLVGKTWNFISPLNPSALTGTALWYAGNLGHRKDQVILTLMPAEKLQLQLGIIDAEVSASSNFNYPIVGSYIKYDLGAVKLGAGLVYGKEEIVATGEKTELVGLTGGVTAKVTDIIGLKAEGYVGRNMDSFLAGGSAMSGVSNDSGIKNRGGFAQVEVAPCAKSKIVIGAGIDDVYTADIVNEKVWNYNFTWFANYTLKLTPNYMWGLEFQRLQTKYFDDASTKENTSRVLMVNRYSF